MPAPEQPYIPFYVRVIDRLKGIGIIIAVVLVLAYALYFYYYPRETAIYTGAVIGVIFLIWILIGQIAALLSYRKTEGITLNTPPVLENSPEMRNISGVGGILSVEKFELGRRLVHHYIRYNPLNKKNPADVSQIVKRSQQVLTDADVGLIIDQLTEEEELFVTSDGQVREPQPGQVINEDFVNNLFQYLVVLSETRFKDLPEETQFQEIVKFIVSRFENKPVSDWPEIHSKILDAIGEYMQNCQTVSKRPNRMEKLADSLV